MGTSSRATKPKGLQLYASTGAFEQHALAATFSISAAENTRKAYWVDVRHWLAFCLETGTDPAKPSSVAVLAWVEAMRAENGAPKTRARRMCGLSSVYDRLRRNKIVTENPFSIDNGPEREVALARTPTPIAEPDAIRKILATCKEDCLADIRDEAMIRILWGTGARRASLLAMTFERLRRERSDYIATLIAKGNKEVRVLIRGKGAAALTRWLAELDRGGISKGAIWRKRSGAEMNNKDVWRMLDGRAKLAGVTGQISPHTFRVAFLTYNPAGLEAKQDAAGHADPATTRLYDRHTWRGREAFEAMPEVDDVIG